MKGRIFYLLVCLALACMLSACAAGGVDVRPRGEAVVGGSVGKSW